MITKMTFSNCVRCTPTITASRIKKMLDNDPRSISVVISELTPNNAFEKVEEYGYTEHDTLIMAVSAVKTKLFVKTASYGGRARFYSK